MSQEYAYVTGAASGIGLEVSRFLTKKGVKVFLADLDAEHLQVAAKELNAPWAIVNVADWDSQEKGFMEAITHFGRLDYVFPIAGIGENTWIPSPGSSDQPGHRFVKPNLSVIDVNVNGMIYTIALAVQQYRRQDIGQNGFRGKILCAGSVCGFYHCSGLPIYTTSKHAVIGLVRSYGAKLPDEKITLNAFCPNVVRSRFSSDAFYQQLEDEGILTSVAGIIEVVDNTLGASNISGECFEIGPNYHKGQGLVSPKFPDFIDEESKRVFAKLTARGNAK